ncbi:MAG: orotate phosphoribosyltransferase [Clostridiales bacterium]|nr:orotate phosphoribosyltransferase [Clostridiales bacterium]
MNDKIIDALFETQAIKMAPADNPFWYTSGMLGPFYCNTHFLLKDEQSAADMLKLIEAAIAEDKLTAPKKIFEALKKYYDLGGTFKMTMDRLAEEAKNYDFDFISGGERRDYFFSMIPAYILGKPHLTIYKDMSSAYSEDLEGDAVVPAKDMLQGKKALHICDLINTASSYERAWVPAIRDLGADITDTLAVVDRCQGGAEVLEGLGVKLKTLTKINAEFFEDIYNNGMIDLAQKDFVLKYLESPSEYMAHYLKTHPDFIAGELAKGGKAADRAKLAIEKGYADT